MSVVHWKVIEGLCITIFLWVEGVLLPCALLDGFFEFLFLRNELRVIKWVNDMFPAFLGQVDGIAIPVINLPTNGIGLVGVPCKDYVGNSITTNKRLVERGSQSHACGPNRTLITCRFTAPKRYLYSSSPRMKSNSRRPCSLAHCSRWASSTQPGERSRNRWSRPEL